MIGSVAICLSSIPMPTTESPHGVAYDFEARRLGNQFTCEIQGFSIMLGLVTSFAYNGTLSLYYAFAIGLRWKETRIQRLEPLFIHFVPIGVGLVTAVVPWIYHNYNPSGLGVACGMLAVTCDEKDEAVHGCKKRGNEHVFNATMTMLIVLIGFLFFAMFVCFGIILVSAVCFSPKKCHDGRVFLVRKQNYKLQRQQQQQQQPQIMSPNANNAPLPPQLDENIQQTSEQQYYACSLTVQIVAYIIPLVLSFIFRGLIILDHGHDGLQSFHGRLTWLSLVFSSLQGFFNMTDFLGHKVYNYRRVFENTSILKSIFIVLKTSDPDPILITGLSLVEISQQMVHMDVVFLNREMERRICKSNSLEDDVMMYADIESDAKKSVGDDVFVAMSDSRPSLGGFSCCAPPSSSNSGEVCKSELSGK